MAMRVTRRTTLPKPVLFTDTGTDALRVLAEASHADREVYEGIFTSCRTGRDWVLTTAPQAHLTLQVTEKQLQHRRTWQRQLAAAKQALATQGQVQASAAASLHVQWVILPGCAPSEATLQAAADRLVSFVQHAGPHISEVTLETNEDTHCPDYITSLLRNAAVGLRSITSLTLIACDSTLPPPRYLPQLRHVNIIARFLFVSEQFWESVGAVLPQLATLRCDASGFSDDGDAAIISACEGLMPHLPELTICTLTDSILSALLDRAQNLKRVEARHLRLSSEQHRAREWGVQELAMVYPVDFIDLNDAEAAARGETLRMLARLPKCRAGADGVRPRLSLGCPTWLDTFIDDQGSHLDLLVMDTEGLPSAFVKRLDEWRFDVKRVTLKLGNEIAHHEMPVALRATFKQLRALQAPSAVWDFRVRQWSQALADVLTEALPSLSHLNITVPEVEDSDSDGIDDL